jgi:protocatechuate 3,4-dioxygenase beta subunit
MRRLLSSRSSLAIVALLAAAAAAGEPPKAPATAPPAASAKPAPRPSLPQSPSTLAVTVLDPVGKPVEGAFVMALPVLGAYIGAELQAGKLRSAITDKDGRAGLDRMPRGPWSVTVRARGFVSRTESRVSVASLTMRLERGGVLNGVVLDGTTRAAIAGARVVVDEGLPLPGEWEERLTRLEAVADARGTFKLEGLGRAPVSLVARAPGYGPGRRDTARAGSRVELFLFPGPTLFGTARDEAGKPVAGATVRLFGEGWSAPPTAEPADAAGRFTASGIEPGEYWVVARAGARAPGLAKVTVTAEDATAEVTLGDGGYVIGRVVDEAGRPISGATLRPETFEGRGLPALVGETMAGSSGADGSFALGPLPAGSLGLLVSHRGHANGRVEAVVRSRQAADLRDVALETGLAVRGRVRDREGAGLPGILVRAEPARGGEGATADAETDADGAFSLSGLPAGAYAVVAEAAGFARARASATAGGAPVEIVMDVGGTISGRVVDAEGRPVEGATVFGESAEPDSSPARSWVYGTTGEDGEGRFTIRDATPTTYVLRVRASGTGEASLAGVEVAAGRTTDVGTVTLARSGTLTGVVVDTDGEGVPGATVLVQREATVSHGDDPRAQTDTAGTFEVRGVRPGRVDLVVSHPAYVSGRASGIEVEVDKEPAPVRIVLSRGGRIEGRARHRDGRPFDDGRVWVAPIAGRGGFGGEPVPTLSDGSFLVDHVPAGRVNVALMTRVPSHPSISGSPGMTILAGVANREMEVKEGETAAVDLVTREVVVAGRVTRGGQGLPGVVVGVMGRDSGAVSAFMGMTSSAASPPQGPPPLSATTREDGGYELLVFGPGRSYVQMRSPEQSYPGREVDVPDVERYELDLEVGDAGVSGVVVDKESAAPVADAQVVLREPGPEGKWKGGGPSGPDGRFSIAAEPGEYLLEARARARKPSTLAITVGSGGLSDVRLEMEAGLDIRGRVLDAAGRPAAEIQVYPIDAEGDIPGLYGGGAPVLPDGSFHLSGLDARPYTLVCGSEHAGFAMRTGVTPSDDPVTLTLGPGGRILARVVGPDSAPVTDIYLRVVSWNGVRFRSAPVGDSRPTEAPGVFEVAVPAGSIEIAAAWGSKTYGSATARVVSGETSSLDLVLSERPPR